MYRAREKHMSIYDYLQPYHGDMCNPKRCMPLDAAIYGSFILGAKILWHIVDFGRSMRTAAEVNEQLRRRRMETVEERREKMRKRH